MRIMWKLRVGMQKHNRPERDEVKHAVGPELRPLCNLEYGGEGRWLFAEGEPTCGKCRKKLNAPHPA